MTPRRWLVAALLALVGLASATASAGTLTVGVFAPGAPFEGTPARIAFATALARHLAAATGDEGIGRVYARAGDFAAAVQRGEVQVAVVDAAFLATHPGGAVIAAAARQGETAPPWQLVARAGLGVRDLRGRALLIPTAGGREADLALHALLGGELPRGYLRISTAPDARSAVAAVGFGKADAALVPAGLVLPSGVRALATLPRVPGAMLVVYPSIAAERRARITVALASFRGDAVIDSFRASDDAPVRALAARLAAPRRLGPMVVPPPRFPVDDLLAGRRFTLERTDARRFVIR